MQTQKFNSIIDAQEFVENMPDREKYIFSAIESDDGTCEVQWQPKKYYTSYTGDFLPDEIWVTEFGETYHVQDLTEEHAKNVLRMLLRNRRRALELAVLGYVPEQPGSFITNDTIH